MYFLLFFFYCSAFFEDFENLLFAVCSAVTYDGYVSEKWIQKDGNLTPNLNTKCCKLPSSRSKEYWILSIFHFKETPLLSLNSVFQKSYPLSKQTWLIKFLSVKRNSRNWSWWLVFFFFVLLISKQSLPIISTCIQSNQGKVFVST